MNPAERVDMGLPLRATVRPSGRGYSPKVKGRCGKIDVILDGVTLDECASWDVIDGVVTRHARDSEGNLILANRVPTFEALRGVVEVRWRKESAA